MSKYINTFIFKTLNSICKIFLEIFIFDKQIRSILKGKLAKLYLKKYVKQSSKIHVAPCDKPKSKIIWQYWEQGIENAPDVVRACIRSVEKYKGDDYKQIILDRESIKEYVQIPENIEKLKEKGIIKSAHYSDILRTYLLVEYGGIWIDATVLLTDELPDYIKDAELFVFQNELRLDCDNLNMASYFISSAPHNVVLEHCKDIFSRYWNENLFLNNYFMFLHAFTMLTQCNEECRNSFAKIPFFSYIPVQRFQVELLNKYNEQRWKQIKSISPIHKLSYKANVLARHRKMETAGTFYEKLVNNQLP